MSLKQTYIYLTRLFDKKNNGEDIQEKTKLSEEEEKLLFFWNECQSSPADISNILAKTEYKIAQDRKKKKKIILLRVASAAASILLILSVGFYFYMPDETSEPTDLLTIATSMMQDIEATKEVTIVTSQTQLNIANDALIQYTNEGSIEVTSDVVEETVEAEDITLLEEKNTVEEYNHLIVPRGKRARLKLSDGTQLWVNSLTKVVYPRTFIGDIRNIYIQGEAYLEVAHDAERPFIVTSDNFNLKVLGTRFNISNYHGNELTGIVLVEGSVEVTDTYKDTQLLTPNDLLTIKEGHIYTTTKVDTDEYISWIKGILILNGIELSVLTHKLSIYYGVNIECSDVLSNQKVYGKLDLKDSLEEILDCIKSTIPFTIEQNEESLSLTR